MTIQGNYLVSFPIRNLGSVATVKEGLILKHVQHTCYIAGPPIKNNNGQKMKKRNQKT